MEEDLLGYKGDNISHLAELQSEMNYYVYHKFPKT